MSSTWNLERRVFLHVLKTHYPSASQTHQVAIFNDHFNTNLAMKLVMGEYSGRLAGVARPGFTLSRNAMWGTEVCRDEFPQHIFGGFNARQRAERYTALQDIQTSIANLQLQGEDGLGQVELANGMEHADPAARAALPAATQTGASNTSLGSSGPVVAGGASGSTMAPPSTAAAEPAPAPVAGPNLRPLTMVHLMSFQFGPVPGDVAGGSLHHPTFWSEESQAIDPASSVYQLGGPVHLVSFDALEDRAVMVCRRDYCDYCHPHPGVLLPVQLPGETDGLPFVHTQDLRPGSGGVWSFHVAEYRKYSPRVTLPNFKRFVRFPDGNVREVRVCDISCMACNLGD